MFNKYFEKKRVTKVFALTSISLLIILLIFVPNAFWTPLCGQGSHGAGRIFDHAEMDISSENTGHSIIWAYNTHQEEYGILALVMNNSNKLIFMDSYNTLIPIFNRTLLTFYLALSNASYYALSVGITPKDSGKWFVPYNDTWHFVLVNNHPSNSTLLNLSYNIYFDIMDFPNHRLYTIIILVLIIAGLVSVTIDHIKEKKGQKKGKFIALLITSFIINIILLMIISVFITIYEFSLVGYGPQ